MTDAEQRAPAVAPSTGAGRARNDAEQPRLERGPAIESQSVVEHRRIYVVQHVLRVLASAPAAGESPTEALWMERCQLRRQLRVIHPRVSVPALCSYECVECGFHMTSRGAEYSIANSQ